MVALQQGPLITNFSRHQRAGKLQAERWVVGLPKLAAVKEGIFHSQPVGYAVEPTAHREIGDGNLLFGKRRILLSDNQRRRLAVKGQILGRKRLEEVGTLFTPDTIMRWHRTLVAKKWDYSDRRAKKPADRGSAK